MGNVATLNVMTASDLANLIPEKWVRKVFHDRCQLEFWNRFEGKEGTQSAVIKKTDFAKEAGDTLHFETLSELYAEVTEGENTLRGNEEKIENNQFDVGIEVYRHAVAVTKKANAEAIVNSINIAGPKLARYFGRLYDDFAFGEILSPANATANIFGTAQASLTASDRLNPDMLSEISLALLRRGALPIRTTVDKYGNTTEFFGCVMDEVSAYHLLQDSGYKQEVREALPRGTDNPIFTNALGMSQGLILYRYRGIHQGCHQGTPQRPECSLSTAGSSGDNTLTVGSVSGRNYTKHFPSSGTLEIYADGTNATETVTYSGKTVNTFTGVSALSNNHIVGSRIVVQGHQSLVIGFGAEVLARAWGIKDQKIAQVDDYTEERGVGVRSVTGIASIEDSKGNLPNAVIMRAYADLPDLASTIL